MTEEEWMECSDPLAMLLFLFGPFANLTDEVFMSRKNLLLACACFARLGELIPPKARLWQEHADLAAEGCYEKRSLHGEGEDADIELCWTMNHATEKGKGRLRALLDLWTWTDTPEWENDGSTNFWEVERRDQAKLIRDIFGNPFHSIIFEPACLLWNDCTVKQIAQGIYHDRAFDRLPILGDALAEAGCTDSDILNHCRQESLHVRGCWVVDLLLDTK